MGSNQSSANSAVHMRQVHLTIGDSKILRDVSLNIPRGQTTVLLGRSGSGKTTLLRLINALALPTSGEVLVGGVSTRDWDRIKLRRRTGYIPQEGGLLPHYTVERNVGLVPALDGTALDEIRTRVRELLTMVNLDPDAYADRYPHELSGGQRQRVGIARALASDPPLLLCDEPFGALDPITRAELQGEFLDLQQRLGKTIVFVTHDVREALLLANRIVLLQDGRVAIEGPPAQFAASADAEARAFLRSIEPHPAAAAM